MKFGEVQKGDSKYYIPTKEADKYIFKGVKSRNGFQELSIHVEPTDSVVRFLKELDDTLCALMKGNKDTWFPMKISDNFIDQCFEKTDKEVLDISKNKKLSIFTTKKERIVVEDLDPNKEVTLIVSLKGIVVEKKKWYCVMEAIQIIQNVEVSQVDYMGDDDYESDDEDKFF